MYVLSLKYRYSQTTVLRFRMIYGMIVLKAIVLPRPGSLWLVETTWQTGMVLSGAQWMARGSTPLSPRYRVKSFVATPQRLQLEGWTETHTHRRQCS